jgi:hypothetical protein
MINKPINPGNRNFLINQSAKSPNKIIKAIPVAMKVLQFVENIWCEVY